MWKLKSKLKRKFRSSKIDCNSNRVDYDVRSFESDSPARPASEQSDTSVVVPGGGGYHRHARGCCSAPVVGREGAGRDSASSENSSLFSYNCCYNYNFHINYNVHHRLQHNLGHHHRHHHHHHHGNGREGIDDTDGTPFGSNSCMTGLGSESSTELPQKTRPVSTERRPHQRTRAGSSASSTKVSSEPDVANKRLLASENKTATRCLSTSDLSSYKSRSEQRSRNGEGTKKGKLSSSGARVRPRSASQRSRADSIENTGTDSVSGDYHTICRRLHAVSLQQETHPSKGDDPIMSRTDLTDHDRRILHCMVLKRIKELEHLEEAVLAKQCWEQEKVFRKSLLDQQERNYRKAIHQKRTIEMIEVRNRKQRLARLEQQQIEKIQNEISEKDIRSASLLKNIEIKKGIRECERRSRELKRLEDATVNQEEKVLDRDIWRQSLVETLEERANRAEGLRRKVMDVYRRRLKIDNQLERKMHAHNLKQTLEQERYKLSLLKERILVRESRFQKFKDSKKRIFDQLKSRAKTTAALRDMVRHTIGPGSSATVVTVSASNTRPGSVVQQQQRCGSSARSAAGSVAVGPVPHRLLDVVRIK